MKIIISFILILGLSFNALASEPLAETTAALKTVTKWLNHLDNNEFKRTAPLISNSMLEAVSLFEVQEVLQKRRQRLGKNISRVLISSEPHGQIYSFTKADYFAFTFQSSYTKQPKVKELVRVIREGSQWLIMSDLLLEGAE